METNWLILQCSSLYITSVAGQFWSLRDIQIPQQTKSTHAIIRRLPELEEETIVSDNYSKGTNKKKRMWSPCWLSRAVNTSGRNKSQRGERCVSHFDIPNQLISVPAVFLLINHFPERASQRTGSGDFTPRLYFHAPTSSVSSVESHFTRGRIRRATRWIDLNKQQVSTILILIDCRGPQCGEMFVFHF